MDTLPRNLTVTTSGLDDAPRRRGRPVGSVRAEPMVRTGVRLPTDTHDQLIALANRREESISKTIHHVLILTLHDRP